MFKMKDEQLIELYLKDNGFRKAKGFAINTQEMNPEEYEEIFYEGKELYDTIQDFVRIVEYWIYEPSDGEQIFEDTDEAIGYVEGNEDLTFEQFKKNRLHKPEVNKSHNNQQNKPSEVSGNSSHD